jgi:hypothetical protein
MDKETLVSFPESLERSFGSFMHRNKDRCFQSLDGFNLIYLNIKMQRTIQLMVAIFFLKKHCSIKICLGW